METSTQVIKKWLPVMEKCLDVPVYYRSRFAMLLESASNLFDPKDMTRLILPHFRKMLATNEYETDFLSVSHVAFIESICDSKSFPGMTRFTLLMNVMNSLPRPTNPTQLISDQALLADKLHDREPALVIAELESRCPTFFDDLPRRNTEKPPTQEQKGQFLCNFIRHYYHQGMRKYQKPNLRKKTSDISIVGVN